jgi:serine/threonine protein kinase/Tol biopolymer transport system component
MNMALQAAARLGPYEILNLVGEGGMGEVYKARDTRLNRAVALKVLPAQFAQQPALRERFEREAHVIANLKHPHICTLHDIGRQDDVHYLVMEFLEGETLAERLKHGPLPLEQLLQYAIEISDALEAAHRQGLTHRDLKPANIMLTKSQGSMLLDFGLAKLKQEVVRATIPLSELPTIPGTLTVHGTLMGTLQYMAPEQVEGKEVDARTDIFAFGTVAYEMATGQRAFEGESAASVIAKILEHDPPPMSTIQPMTPPALERVIRKCLAKDPDKRWQAASDLCDELKWLRESSGQTGMPAPSPPGRKLRERLAWAVALLAVFLLGGIVFPRRPAAPVAQPLMFSVSPPQTASFAGTSATNSMVLSPDGTQLAFRTFEAGQAKIWVHPLNALEARPVQGTEGVEDVAFFWSPDSRFLGFVAQGRLKKVEVGGGSPVVLADLTGGMFGGGTWNAQGTIVYGLGLRGLFRVAETGGNAVRISVPDTSRGELTHALPYFLPDGRRFLYTVRATGAQPEVGGIYVGSLDSPSTQRLLPIASQAAYAPPGYLLYVRDGTLLAQPFDVERLELSGEAFSVAEPIAFNPGGGNAAFSVTSNGLLAYRTGSSTANSQLAWFDRSGRQLRTIGPPANYLNPTLSPDGRRVAVEQFASGSRDIWIVESESGVSSRLTFDPAPEFGPIWSPDGRFVIFTRKNNGYQKSSSGAGAEEVLLQNAVGTTIWDGSSDGRFLVYRPMHATDIWAAPLGGDRTPFGLLQTEFNEINAQISPQGTWIAYLSNESGRYEVYVQSFPKPGGKWQITTSGGVQPRWSRNGKELFYIALDGTLMAVPVRGTESFEVGTPQPLFVTRTVEGPTTAPNLLQQYDVSPDGQRFLMNVPTGGAAASPTVTVVANWLAALTK